MYGIISGIYRDMGVNSFSAPFYAQNVGFLKKASHNYYCKTVYYRPHGPPSKSASVSLEQFRDHLDIDSICSSLMGSNRTN